MSENYKDYVLCKVENNEKPYLFYAPAFSYLKKDDVVICETKYGEKVGTVLCDSLTLGEYEEDKIEFIHQSTGAGVLKRVLAKVSRKDFKYEE